VLVVDNAHVGDGDRNAVFFPRLLRCLRRHGAAVCVVQSPADVYSYDGPRPIGIVLSGGPAMLTSRTCFRDVATNAAAMMRYPSCPVLGVCFGMQCLVHLFGGRLRRLRNHREGVLRTVPTGTRGCEFDITAGVNFRKGMRYSFSDATLEVPRGFNVVAESEDGIPVCIERDGQYFGVQFHPEASGRAGETLIGNFLLVCDLFAAQRA